MSDEEDEAGSSHEEGFSASEDEWKPGKKDLRGGETSDDDDSDFCETSQPKLPAAEAKRRDQKPKGRSATKQQAVKKRKAPTQSLRSKLYNKYKPPPKTLPTRSSDNNSPSASTSKTTHMASKNAKTPNDGSDNDQNDDNDNNNSSSESSVEDYLVNPAELDLRSSFFDVGIKAAATEATPPHFDCNAGAQLSDSGSEDNDETSGAEEAGAAGKSFDFRNLLENVSSLERVKQTIAKRAATTKQQDGIDATAIDVGSLLALGENQNAANTELPPTHDTKGRQKLRQTKSTRQKRHTKLRAGTASAAGADSEDSDWEEVADENCNSDEEHATATDGSMRHSNNASLMRTESLEIHVDLPNRQRSSKDRKQQDLEAVLKRKLNRDIKERQMLLHKTSLLCCFARNILYNRLLNDTTLMQEALKLLPSKQSYPPERGTELKYLESLSTWFKTAIKLKSELLYAQKMLPRHKIKEQLCDQLKKKEAKCKQDMVFMFIILVRGMGLQCRLVVNMQPLPLRPLQSELCTITLKKKDDDVDDKQSLPVVAKVAEKLEVAKQVKAKRTEETNKILNNSKEIVKAESSTATNTTIPKSKEKTNAEKKAMIDKNKPTTSGSSQDKKATNQLETARSKAVKTKEKCDINEASNKIKEKRQRFAENRLGDKDKEPNTLANFEITKPALSKLKRMQTNNVVDAKKPKLFEVGQTPIARRTRLASNDKPQQQRMAKPVIDIGSPVMPKTMLNIGKTTTTITTNAKKVDSLHTDQPSTSTQALAVVHETRSRSKSPKIQISTAFLETKVFKEKFSSNSSEMALAKTKTEKTRASSKSPNEKVKISTKFLKSTIQEAATARVLRARPKPNEDTKKLQIPQLDGADDDDDEDEDDVPLKARHKIRKPQLKKLQTPLKKDKNSSAEDSDYFEPSPSKRPKLAPVRPKAVENKPKANKREVTPRNVTASDMWVEVWSDVEEEWICIDLFKGKLHSVEAIRKSATSSFAYVYAFQNDLSIKDITARYCPHWTTTVRKSRVETAWLNAAISSYLGRRTKRDIREDQQLRRIHEEKPMPTTISDYKDHPLYALERHLLKFQAIYPPEPPTLGFVRGEPVYSRDCVHTLHSREIWLKQARTVKLGEQPYKIVKSRPKWDRLTQTVIKDQPLEIFGYWQTQDYEPPTAENGMVPRNAYGNVELFKECMLPKKTVHLRLAGLNRVCRKLGIDCAQAVVGFDFHQGASHPTYDGFVVCEEFGDQVTAAWHQDQEEQERKEQDKYEARVYGNWKKLIRGLLIRERLKRKYNF